MSLPFNSMYKTPGDKKKMKDGFFAGFGKKKDKLPKKEKTIKELKEEKARLELRKSIRELTPKKKTLLEKGREFNAEYRKGVLAKKDFQAKKLEARVQRYQYRQQLPRHNKVAFGKPLSDKPVRNTINKSRGGPLSDFKPKPKLDSDESFKNFVSGKGGI